MEALRLPDGREVDCKYFVNWRTWLWARPTCEALRFLGSLQGKRVLEFGGGDGRMSCLLALMGAEVTMVDITRSASVEREITKWNVSGRVHYIITDGTLKALEEKFCDAIFGKSVLYCIADLPGLLDEFNRVLVPGGRFAFVENYRGGCALMWLRRACIYRSRRTTDARYFGIRPGQIEIFRNRFDILRAERHRCLVYLICGEKRVEQL